MSQPNRSAAESDAIRSSHSRFMNHFLNERISSDPPTSFSTRPESITRASLRCDLERRIVQNLFNHLRLVDLAVDHEYRASVLSWLPYRGSQWGEGVMSVTLRFEAPSSEVAFDIHAYVTPARTIAGSGMLDPKGIHLQRRIHINPINSTDENA